MIRFNIPNEKVSSNPFAAMSEEDFLQKLERSRTHASQGMIRNADDVIADMRNSGKTSN